MRNMSVLLAVALGVTSAAVCQAATLVSTDFTHNADGWVLLKSAKLLTRVNPGGPALSLSQDRLNQIGAAWTQLLQPVPSFSFTADVAIHHGDASCPADAFAMVYAPMDPPDIGGTGAVMGMFEGGISSLAAFEINTWKDQGLGTPAEQRDCKSGKNITFAFDVVTPSLGKVGRFKGENGTPDAGGAKIGQVVPPPGMQIMNGGVYRYQWNVAADSTMTVYVTGLSPWNQQFKKVKVLEVKINPDLQAIGFEGRWGLVSSTGGATQAVEVYAARIDVPAIDPL